MKLLIKGGRVIDPANGTDEILDILVEDGIIAELKRFFDAKGQGAKVIDAQGKTVVPGLVDMHAHLREPGFEHKETIETGCLAAAAGGFTTVACMANTLPVNDNASVTRIILERATAVGTIDVLPVGAVTKGLMGEELAEFGPMKEAGVVAFCDDGNPIMDSGLLRRALEWSGKWGLPILSHCEDLNLSRGGVMNEGDLSKELGLQGIPPAAEEVMVARDIILADLTKGKLHLCHVSTAGSVELIQRAKSKGIPVTAETAPHYFTLTEKAVRDHGTNAKINPPLRTPLDREAIKDGLKDGTIDAIATDHAPHEAASKEADFSRAPSGIIGLETALSLTLRLVDEGVLSMDGAIAKLSTNPSRILGLNRGTLSKGSRADLTIFEPKREFVLEKAGFRSKARNTPFDGWKLRGVVELTIARGKIVYQGNDSIC
ncbi:MAG: dihydroorotase [Syntrophobacterales bacterium]|nr:MAG: dihydroorotase [Syntrophobacterales bacterium]